MSPDLDAAVIGAGLSGLETARRLRSAGRDVHVFEAADRVGGRMRTLRKDGYLIDEGAEAVAGRGFPETWRLISRLGMSAADVPRICGTIATWRGGHAHPGVGRLRGMLTGLGLSPKGRAQLLRFTCEMAKNRGRFDPDRPEATPLGEQTVAQLCDRYGAELGDWLLQPLVTGFTGWYPERSAAGPFLAHLLATGSTADWRTYRDGMDTLARRLAAALEVTTGARVQEVSRHGEGARIAFADGRCLTARSVVLAVPAPAAAALYPGMPADEQPYVHASSYSVRLRVAFALRTAVPVAAAPTAYALLVSQRHDQVVSAVTVDHRKNPGRVPEGAGLVSVLTSPDASRALIGAPDAEITGEIAQRAEEYLPGLRAAIVFSTVHRFRHGVPEATPAALRLRGAFLNRPLRAVDYAGDWLMQRPSAEGALRSAALTAARLLEHLSAAPRATAPGSGHG